ncbi:MAG: MoaD/ThiS family protein [Syntrophaceae bacterium]|nr:MoaD/ThiS family protein [Syntrophaceae bacterium]
MKIRIKLVGFPEIERAVGGKEVDFQMKGRTFGDLLQCLEKNYGKPVIGHLHGHVLRNGKEWIQRENLTYALEDGDQITFLQMMGGG